MNRLLVKATVLADSSRPFRGLKGLGVEKHCSRNIIALHCCLNSLSEDRSLRICKQDKGNQIALLNSDDYESKLQRIISDKTKFSKAGVLNLGYLYPFGVRNNKAGGTR